MRAMMRIALAATVLAVGGLLTVSATNVAFANTKHVTHHHKRASGSSAAATATGTGALPGTPRPSGLARDRVSNPGRGNPDRTPSNATTEPF